MLPLVSSFQVSHMPFALIRGCLLAEVIKKRHTTYFSTLQTTEVFESINVPHETHST